MPSQRGNWIYSLWHRFYFSVFDYISLQIGGDFYPAGQMLFREIQSQDFLEHIAAPGKEISPNYFKLSLVLDSQT